MKRFLSLAILMAVGSLAFAQKSTDPSVSANNYKHANKAAYAKKHNLDKSSELKVVTVTENGDYKHPARKSRMTKKAELTVGTGAQSHKHPLGI